MTSTLPRSLSYISARRYNLPYIRMVRVERVIYGMNGVVGAARNVDASGLRCACLKVDILGEAAGTTGTNNERYGGLAGDGRTPCRMLV
jgi:hypothetical protein